MVQMAADSTMKQAEPYLGKFDRFEKESGQPPWLLPLRKAGLARFAEQGFPTINDEDWRFTNVTPITKLPFKPAFEAQRNGLNPDSAGRFTFGSLPAQRFVFVNGHFLADLSSRDGFPAGVIATNLAAALRSHADLIEKHLGRLSQAEENPFAALNTAFFQDGAFIYAPKNTILEKPIHLLFISTGKEAGITSHPRNLIIAERNSRLTVMETYASTVDAPHFTNAVTELIAGEEAVIEHCKTQEEAPSAFHLAAFHAHLGRGCNLISHSIATGARLSRNNIRTSLAGEGVECVLNGLYLTKGEQLADHHMIVEHAEPHCQSHEYYNGILDGKSKGVFHGRILVRKIAQKTDAKQTNKNLLLSDNATVDTKPQLEIYADDVKCTHGATIGQLNDEAIFYLRARGIGVDTARRMLIHAFAGEIIERIRYAPAREELDKAVWDRLEANAHV